ncbi:hypothetical protein MUP59_01045 [Candidatus Bathyarchaeota archaeon]|nr:hypothetical protein [Candidatus Bathyarchaeota archaeon]
MSKKETTSDGWKIPIFRGSDFDVFYRYICAKNNTGLLMHETKDRVIRVLAGRLYVVLSEETQELIASQSITLERGTVYGLATSGTEDVELIVCQGHDYANEIKQISAPESVSVVPMAANPKAAPQTVRRSESIAQQQAAQLGAAKEEKRKASRTPYQGRAPLVGQQVIGLNPRPIGAAGFSGE